MARGDKSAYTSKQKRQAEHIEKGYEKRGTGKKEAERRAWATVRRQAPRRRPQGFREEGRRHAETARTLDGKDSPRITMPLGRHDDVESVF
jgi:hypothetical protein